jgi:DNA-binding CsgD family transcriptional regulator
MNKEEFARIYPSQLTPRQNQVLIPFLQGKNNQEIAQIINVNDPATISKHIRAIAEKFGFTDYYRDNVIDIFLKYRPNLVSSNPETPPPPYPDKPEPAKSYFYIERQPIEYKCFQQLREPGSLLRIKASKHMGKTSVLNQVIEEAKNQNYFTVILDFKLIETSKLDNEAVFLKTFYTWAVNKLESCPPLSEWDDNLPIMESCTQHFKAILKQLEKPLVLIIDNLDRIFDYPDTYQNFLPMLRHWHDLANENEAWEKLRLVITYCTEDYGRLDIDQSPFNVGFPVSLRDFNYEEIELLRKRHYGLNEKVVKPLMEQLEGHPSLIRLAFYYLAKKEFTLKEILANAASYTGIYKNHFRQLIANLRDSPQLEEVLEKIIANQCLEINGRNNCQIYQLEAMGLVKIQGNLALISRQIYQTFFADYFKK